MCVGLLPSRVNPSPTVYNSRQKQIYVQREREAEGERERERCCMFVALTPLPRHTCRLRYAFSSARRPAAQRPTEFVTRQRYRDADIRIQIDRSIDGWIGRYIDIDRQVQIQIDGYLDLALDLDVQIQIYSYMCCNCMALTFAFNPRQTALRIFRRAQASGTTPDRVCYQKYIDINTYVDIDAVCVQPSPHPPPPPRSPFYRRVNPIYIVVLL